MAKLIASSKLTGTHSEQMEWMSKNRLCWFCVDELNKNHNKHHLVPIRYFKKRADAHTDNVIRVCMSCHIRFHNEQDNSKWSLTQYIQAMESIDFGFGLYIEG